MAFEEVPVIIQWILWNAVLFVPLVYLVLAIRKRLEPNTFVREVAVVFFISILLALGSYPFLAGLAQYAIALDSGIEIDLLLFDSDYATYGIVLLFVFLIYLIVFNKTKER